MGSDDPYNVTYPIGTITISPSVNEISGRNPERQDFIIGPNAAPSFAGYFVARFDQPIENWGTATGAETHPGENEREGKVLSGYVQFKNGTSVVNVRIGTSFISVDQARKNLDTEIPDGQALEETAYQTRMQWKDKLEMINIEGATESNKTTFYTAFFHTLQVLIVLLLLISLFRFLIKVLQYPYERDEGGNYYSGYDDSVHKGVSYDAYSIWVWPMVSFA